MWQLDCFLRPIHSTGITSVSYASTVSRFLHKSSSMLYKAWLLPAFKKKTNSFLLGHAMIRHYNSFMKQLANGYNGTPTFMY